MTRPVSWSAHQKKDYSKRRPGYFSWLLFSVSLTFLLVLSVELGIPLVGTAVAASMYLAFLCPSSVFSTPWRIGGSYFLAMVYGLGINLSYGVVPLPLNRILALCIVLLFVWNVVRLRVEHPPAASVLMSFAMGSLPSLFQIFVFCCITASVILLDYLFEVLRRME